MRRLILVLCLLATTASASAADFAITALTVDKTTVTSGDRFRLTMTVRNDGTDAVLEPNVNILNSYGERLTPVASTAPAGWTCSPVYPTCYAQTLAPGAQAELSMTLLAPTTVRPVSALTVRAHLSSTNDLNSSNNQREVQLQLQASSRRAELAISVEAPQNPVPKNTPITLAYTVRNNGPDSLSNLRLSIGTQDGVALLPLSTEGSGWTCAPQDRFTICTRASLEAGASAPLAARFTTPSTDVTLDVEAEVVADQPHADENPSNQEVITSLSIGNAADWTRILVPLVTAEGTPGANGALWQAELTGLIDSSEQLTTWPDGCGGLEDPCGPPPLRKAFDPREEDLIYFLASSQFIYVDRADAPRLRVATRVYDSNRETETAGAFVPSPRDEDFSSDGFSLIGIPVAPEYRTALRIYDYAARDGAAVEVELYGDDEDTPFATTTQGLDVEGQLMQFTTAQLPSHPATALIDLGSLLAGRDYERVRVRVTPHDPSVRLWGIVSITNNETHHVTVVTP